MAIKDKEGRWRDPAGEFVPPKYIKTIDKRRDKLVEDLIQIAEEVSIKIAELKKLTLEGVDDHLAWIEKEYKIDQKTKEGNKVLSNFSMDKKVEIKIHKFVDFDERLNAAKSLIDDLIVKWSKGADEKLVVLVNEAFKTDGRGRLDKNRILSLRKLDFKEKEWKKAMELIADSVQVSGKRAYTKFWRKTDKDTWETITLDIATI